MAACRRGRFSAIYNRVTDTALSLQGAHEPRTLNQLRTDVAIDLLASGVTETGLGATINATVNITVPVLSLMGHTEEPAELEGYGPIDPETARRLAGTAKSFLRVLTHPHTGVVLGVSSTAFRVPAALKKYLQVRDETCRFPGCNRAARHSDLDHTVDKQCGGSTAANNLYFLCPAHHALTTLAGSQQVLPTEPCTGPARPASITPLILRLACRPRAVLTFGYRANCPNPVATVRYSPLVASQLTSTR